uniref:DUF4235 domain-containing protein n=1 Tax=Streptomyces sp. PU_AKi4 TaxID=2800809 RepID=UPI0035235FCB
KLPLAYKPIGFALGWTSGTVAGLAFQKTWKVIRHEDDAPDALDRDRRWGEPPPPPPGRPAVPPGRRVSPAWAPSTCPGGR